MSSIEKQHLLTAKQMAEFAVNGFLRLDEVVPQELNEAAYKEQREFQGNGSTYWNESKVIQDIFNLPQVKGALQSFVGQYPIYDHSFMHIVRAKHLKGQGYHADSVIDTRPFGYDIQAFYFSHDAPDEMGPTLVLPGSHLRKVSNGSISRYKNIVGQKRMVAKAGTIGFLHHGIWHCAQPNHTDETRYVFKPRVAPVKSSAICSIPMVTIARKFVRCSRRPTILGAATKRVSIRSKPPSSGVSYAVMIRSTPHLRVRSPGWAYK